MILLGPTASGKTDLALELAEQFKLDILNIDSRQLYRGMDIGTAKPTPEQQQLIATAFAAEDPRATVVPEEWAEELCNL